MGDLVEPELILAAPGAHVRVQGLARNTLRITHALPGEARFPTDPVWLGDVFLPQDDLSQSDFQASFSGDRLNICSAGGKILLAEAAPPRFRRGRVRLSFQIHPGEGFYGGGEWFNAFRREQGSLRLKAQESPSVLQARQTYSAFPLFFSSRGYALFLLNSFPGNWHINRSAGRLEVQAQGGNADYVFIYGPSFREILATYTLLTGRPPLLPRWAFGLWVTSYPQGHQDAVTAHVAEHRRRSIPLDAAILDYHWEEKFHNFHWRSSLFPQPGRLVQELKDLGMHLGLIFTPFVNAKNLKLQRLILQVLFGNATPEMVRADERALPEYAEARARGYLAHPNALWWFGRGGMLDFTNPAAAAWWNAKLRALYEQGVEFFKNDDGEFLPASAQSATGMGGREYHNLYGFYYGKAIYEGMAGYAAGRRPLIYARSVWAGSQRYPALFMGDQIASFLSIQRTLRAGLNLSLSGFAYWTADVFGLSGKTTPEIHMRYAQWALFSPVARYFYRPPEIDNTRLPWSHGPDVEANFRRYSQLRYRLLPYFYTLAWQSYQTGLPILRPLVLEFQEDARLAGVTDQVMLGDRLMLAPVVEIGAVARKVLLPGGVWHDFWSEKSWEGPGEIEYDAPVDRLPLLVRGGTILPLGPVLENIPAGHQFDRLELHLWPPFPAEFTLYDDDGQTLAYQSGVYSLTGMRAEGDALRLRLVIDPSQSSFPGQALARQVEVVLHRLPAPAQVLVDGRASADWSFDTQAGETRLGLVAGRDAATQIEFLFEQA